MFGELYSYFNFRLSMRRLLSLTLLSLAAEHVRAQERDSEHQGPQPCGGHLKAAVGTITTPNFPNPFPVPIKCKWIIEHDIVNGTISIYFTQQYTTSGLTFTEYMYYDETYKLGERRALTVTEENITRIKWLQVQSPVLVVELNLNRVEGTQLRALGLLAVYGFNVTYEVRAPTRPPGPTSCSAIECRLLGHCYARQDYQEFFCSCFEGYSGADCGVGPRCPSTNLCKNGGTCRQMGPAAVSCICAPGYTGDLCEAQLAPPECGIEECAEVCKDGTACDCNPKDTDFASAKFETGLQVVGQVENISQEIVKELTTYLRASNITLEDEIEILNISSEAAGGARTARVRVWGARREAGALRAALARLAASRSRAHALRILPTAHHVEMQPALSLHTLVVNQRPELWEGSEFILTCMAYGSPNIAFTWYKDGVKINFNGTTRDIWTRTVSEDALGRRMSVLGVSEAKRLDGGKWSCAADDAGRRRCRALRLTVLRPPDIRLVPSTITVHKGDNVSITCLAGAGRVHGVLGFSWARERTLLPMVPGKEVWEDLYPAGSVLKLYNVQKSSEFRCQVSSVAGTNAKGVTMWALGADDVACESDASHGLRWPKTAPGAHATASCPPGHSGETTRFCEPKTGQQGVKWMLPDFSGCVAESLRDIYEQFTLISLGYSWGAVSHVSRQYGSVLRSLPTHPGEGQPPLTHASHMLQYLLSTAAQPADRYHSAEHLLNIYDTLLKHPDAFLDEEKIFDLQKAVVDTAGMRSDLDKRYQEFTVKTKSVHDDNAAHFELQPAPVRSEEWVVTSAGVELAAASGNASVVTVLYHNLGARLPSLRRYVEYNTSSRSGRATEYTVASQQVQVSVSGAGVDASLPHTVTLLFAHSKNYSAIASQLACGVRSRSSPRVWSMQACEVRVPEHTHVACRCRGLATIALFTVDRETLTDSEKDLRGIVKVTVSLGGAMCLVAALLQLLSLVAGSKARLPILLKAATAATHSAAVLALLECDTRQSACPGPLGWVCAACWCAGCAALCAQPLLLHAELAASATRAPSVGLLAGVCTLCWLTARLWGGAPLQLGAAANAVCGAGAALLAALTLCLALCAARTLRTVTHKLPPDRRSYVRERARVVRHTLVLLFTTSATQAAGVAYAQPGERTMPHVTALSVAALANGIAMLICYVICDEECLHAARRLLTLSSHNEWHESPEGDTSLSLYIKQGREVECSSSHVSPANTYWRAPPLEAASTMHRRESSGACVADIVRCVEYKQALLSPRAVDSRALCDLIPTGGASVCAPTQSHVSHVCVELRVLPASPPVPRAQAYSDSSDTPKESCTMCSQSSPDVSVPAPAPARPIKSCLKKRSSQLSWSSSLPSIHRECDDDNQSHTQLVNTHSPTTTHTYTPTDKVLNKISHDLDFLLNRTPSRAADACAQRIEEAPT
ncbi:uncharacterized protein LOC124640017 isoform X2 [Helicoverpa zea]|uniref:uncharacterized protein LOC124640017 isoform X2 n=1 Tax=Helicoverpa zea TaxID=7113 RepID=UPI001F56E49D|nr:uncharacterized protein LOC124640017 isoform X2 [Helicoverpa zea]